MASSKLIIDMSKLEPLDGKNYTRWSVRMSFYLEQIDVAYVPNGKQSFVVDTADNVKEEYLARMIKPVKGCYFIT